MKKRKKKMKTLRRKTRTMKTIRTTRPLATAVSIREKHCLSVLLEKDPRVVSLLKSESTCFAQAGSINVQPS